MGTAATPFGGLAALVFPVSFGEKRDIYSPNRHHLTRLKTACLVHGVAPDDVPTWVIVMRLQRPRASRPLGLQSMFRRWTQPSAQRKIGETLLGHSGVFVFLIRAESVKSLDAHDSNDAAKDVGLLEIDVNQLCGTSFNMLNGSRMWLILSSGGSAAERSKPSESKAITRGTSHDSSSNASLCWLPGPAEEPPAVLLFPFPFKAASFGIPAAAFSKKAGSCSSPRLS
jgi:hypothetical protein